MIKFWNWIFDYQRDTGIQVFAVITIIIIFLAWLLVSIGLLVQGEVLSALLLFFGPFVWGWWLLYKAWKADQ